MHSAPEAIFQVVLEAALATGQGLLALLPACQLFDGIENQILLSHEDPLHRQEQAGSASQTHPSQHLGNDILCKGETGVTP